MNRFKILLKVCIIIGIAWVSISEGYGRSYHLDKMKRTIEKRIEVIEHRAGDGSGMSKRDEDTAKYMDHQIQQKERKERLGKLLVELREMYEKIQKLEQKIRERLRILQEECIRLENKNPA